MNGRLKIVASLLVLSMCAAPALSAPEPATDVTQVSQPGLAQVAQEQIDQAVAARNEQAKTAVSQAQQVLGREGFSIYLGAAFGAGMIILGAGYGFSRIGSCAVESMARQPEVAGNIQTSMIIAAALLEGATFFALIVCIITV